MFLLYLVLLLWETFSKFGKVKHVVETKFHKFAGNLRISKSLFRNSAVNWDIYLYFGNSMMSDHYFHLQDWYSPDDIYLYMVNNGNIKTIYKICSKLTIKTLELHQESFKKYVTRKMVFFIPLPLMSHFSFSSSPFAQDKFTKKWKTVARFLCMQLQAYHITSKK